MPIDAILPARVLGIVPCEENPRALRMPLEMNTNDKGSMFAGSIYSLAVLAGYHVAEKQAADQQLVGDLFAGSTRITFRRPVTTDAVALGHLRGEFAKSVSDKWRIEVAVVVKDAAGTNCARFEGVYVLSPRTSDV